MADGPLLSPVLGASASAQLRHPGTQPYHMGTTCHCAHSQVRTALDASQAPCLSDGSYRVTLKGRAPLAGVLREQALVRGAHQRLQRHRRQAIPVPVRQLLQEHRISVLVTNSGMLQ